MYLTLSQVKESLKVRGTYGNYQQSLIIMENP